MVRIGTISGQYRFLVKALAWVCRCGGGLRLLVGLVSGWVWVLGASFEVLGSGVGGLNGRSGRTEAHGWREGAEGGRLCGELEFGLGRGSGWCDRRGPGGQANALQVWADGVRLGQGGDDIHATAAGGALS